MSVINIGSINIDHCYNVPRIVTPGETMTSTTYNRGLGGKGMNQSIALQRAGLNVCHVGAVGTEDDWVLAQIAAAGIDRGHIARVSQATGHAVIQIDPHGQNSIVLHPGANHALDVAHVQSALQAHADCEWVLTQNETNDVAQIIDLALAAGRRVALNPAPCEPGLARLPLERLAVLIVNEIEAEQLTGCTTPSQAFEVLARRCPQTLVVITLGADGLWAAQNGQTWRQDAIATQVVDTTAAGDTITGYLLAGLDRGLAVPKALEWAARAAAVTVSRSGAAQSIPSWREVAMP